MISTLGSVVSRIMERIVPDPFVIAILLTLLTAVASLIWGDYGGDSQFGGLIDAWSNSNSGLWALLAFAMQMCLILVTGYALATTALVRKCIDGIADIPQSTGSAAATVGFIACVAGLVNWGLGLIVGALLAREVGFSLQRRNIPCHYPLIAAAGFMGLLVWHGGLSGSAPLTMTTESGAAKVIPEQYLGSIETVLLSDSIGSSLNFFVSGGLLILAPLVLFFLAPKDASTFKPISVFKVDSANAEPIEKPTESIPDKLNHSIAIALCIAAPLFIALGRHVIEHGLDKVGLNQIIMFMLALGVLLHRSPLRYMEAACKGATGCAGIMIQFPLYAGIMAMMAASGLMAALTEVFVANSTSESMPIFTMISAGIVNLFVPSGGGQWAIQAPVALESGMQLGIAPGKMVMAVAYGDQLTNMLQPFWALPLLAITGVRARDIVGYTAVVMIAALIWITIGLIFQG